MPRPGCIQRPAAVLRSNACRVAVRRPVSVDQQSSRSDASARLRELPVPTLNERWCILAVAGVRVGNHGHVVPQPQGAQGGGANTTLGDKPGDDEPLDSPRGQLGVQRGLFERVPVSLTDDKISVLRSQAGVQLPILGAHLQLALRGVLDVDHDVSMST